MKYPYFLKSASEALREDKNNAGLFITCKDGDLCTLIIGDKLNLYNAIIRQFLSNDMLRGILLESIYIAKQIYDSGECDADIWQSKENTSMFTEFPNN